MQGLFTSSEPWSGGFFELAIQFERFDARLRRKALQALWRHESLEGGYLRRDIDPAAQRRVDPSGDADSVYGIASTPNRVQVPCASFWTDCGDDGAWLSLAVPMQSLGRAYPVGAFPIEDGRPLEWRDPVMHWLCQISLAVHEEVPIDLGLVGWEPNDSDLTAATIRTSGVPPVRYDGVLIPEGSRLNWYPPTHGASMLFERGGA